MSLLCHDTCRDMRKTNLCYIFIAILLTGISCSKSNDPKAPVENIYVIQGDPMSIVENTSMDPSLPFTEKNIGQFSESHLLSRTYYYEKIKPRKRSSAEDGNEAPTETYEPKPASPFSFEKKSDKQGDYYSLESEDPDEINLAFEIDSSGKLYRPESWKAQVLHFSMTPDQKYFNFLYSSTTKSGQKYLASFTFTTAQTDEKLVQSHTRIREIQLSSGAWSKV